MHPNKNEPDLLQIGQKIDNKYEVERFLGHGGFAEVYRVKHRFLGRLAMKVLKTPGSMEEIYEMLSEAAILSRMSHPNIIRVFDAGTILIDGKEHGYFTMEYVAGGNLESFRLNHRTELVRLDITINIIKQICEGLKLAHSENPPIIHRDIKPQNIMIGYDDTGLRVRVSDFGLAKKVNELTRYASARGTPIFKPPEAVDNIDTTSSDIWGIGCILYLLLTDRLPYDVKNEFEIYTGECWKRKLILPSHFNPTVDKNLDYIVSKTLAVNRSERYKDVLELLRDLNRWKSKNEQVTVRTSVEKIADVSSGFNVDEIVSKAIKLSKEPGKLKEATDLMEEAMNKDPTIREKYEYNLQLWRKNIVI